MAVELEETKEIPVQPYDNFLKKYDRKGRLRTFQLPKHVQIWQCLDLVTGEECSLKVMKKRKTKASDFQREIAILKECKGHPNLLHVKDVYQDNKFYYIVTGSLEHPNILQTIEAMKEEGQTVGPAQVATIIKTLMNALVYCHDHHNKSMKAKKTIVHGNIQPKNILVPKGQSLDNLILVDFSKAQMDLDFDLEEDCDSDSESDSSNDGQTKKKSRRQFRAPEYGQDGPTEKADLWAVGVLTFLLLTGHYPFSKPSEIPLGIQDWHGIQDPDCRQFISNMLKDKPSKRPAAKDINKGKVWFNAEAEIMNSKFEVDLGQVMYRLTTISHEHDFQVAVRSYIATSVLQSDDRHHLDQIFRTVDINNNNNLSRTEFEQALVKVDIDFLDKDAVDSYFKMLDANGDKRISYTEFMAFVEDQELLFAKKRLRAAFDAFDFDKSGSISAKDILWFSNSAGGASAFQGENVVTQKTIQSMIERADKNGNGKISFGEFTDMMLGTDNARLV